MTLDEALDFAENGGSIEPTDEEVEKILAAEVWRLRGLLGLFMLDCGFLHHAKADQHMSTEPCPVEARIKMALEGKRA